MKRIGLSSRTRRLELAVFILGCIGFAYAFTVHPKPAFAEDPAVEPVPIEALQTDKDYSKFQHGNAFHSRLPCLLCHRRDDNSSRLGFPGKSAHLPCAGCHQLQFSDNTSPICTICHTDPQTGGMKRFPGLKSFTAKFDHGRHLRVNCAVCHKPSRRGVALSIPTGATAHNTCFQCHSSSAPFNMSSCSVCHVPGRRNWTSEWARSFKLGFSHATHVRGADLNCSKCHSVMAGAPRGRQVSSPRASMHFATAGALSCGGCHNGKRAFGPDEFTNCKRCHQGKSFKF